MQVLHSYEGAVKKSKANKKGNSNNNSASARTATLATATIIITLAHQSPKLPKKETRNRPIWLASSGDAFAVSFFSL